MKLTCTFDRVGSKPFNAADLLGSLTEDGVLSDEHAMSSYGLPVLVSDSGHVYGPADLPASARIAATCRTPDEVAFVRRAAQAGYRVGYDLPGDDIGGPGRDPLTGERP